MEERRRADGEVARGGHAVLEDAVDVHRDVAAVERGLWLLRETVEHHRDLRPAVQSACERGEATTIRKSQSPGPRSRSACCGTPRGND